jgi:predicted alpha/beta-hydrolase family hydrolase
MLVRPERARLLYVMAHGAGAGMRHPFLEAMASALAERRVATWRYEFPYMAAGPSRPEAGISAASRAATDVPARRRARPKGGSPGQRRPPDRPDVLEACVRANVAAAQAAAPGLPVVAGGKSMGGRMTSRAQAAEPMPGVRGLAFLGFPLHPAGAPGVERAAHLDAVRVRMLFLQGTRDALADLALLGPIVARLGRRARLHVVEGADHGFRVGKGRDVIAELADAIVAWAPR